MELIYLLTDTNTFFPEETPKARGVTVPITPSHFEQLFTAMIKGGGSPDKSNVGPEHIFLGFKSGWGFSIELGSGQPFIVILQPTAKK